MEPITWRDARGYWSVNNGTQGQGLAQVVGYIFEQPDNTWKIEGDALKRVFLDKSTATHSLLKTALPQGVQYYELKRHGETASQK